MRRLRIARLRRLAKTSDLRLQTRSKHPHLLQEKTGITEFFSDK